MHILHEGLQVLATFHVIAQESVDHMRSRGQTIISIEHDEPLGVHDVHLAHDESGAVVARLKARFETICSAARAGVGDEVVLSPVPPGASIMLDGRKIGVMDDSGAAELTLTMPGRHLFALSLDGYMDKEFVVEVDG